jgi:hypothetical protein
MEQKHFDAEFKQAFGQHAGIEDTLAQGERMCDLCHSRYVGQAKTPHP